MGVKGLMTYMLNDGSSLKSYKLRKSKVIIDGNNLLHSIHHAHKIIWQFGGEYESFDKALVKFFERLKICELEPFVVFDGCYDAQGSKFKTTISRFKDRIYTCGKLNKQYTSEGYLLPMLSIQTMIPVLQRMNISYVTCHEEADKEVAALANHFNCPIISNDSDFFIFPLNCGFIPVGSLNFVPVEENCVCCPNKSHWFLSCAMFQQSNFYFKSAKCSPVKKELLPLFSLLMGNDLLSLNFFDVILLQNANGRKSKKNFKSSSKVISILTWLHQFQDVESALYKILLSIRENERPRLEHLMGLSLAQYDLSHSNLVEAVKLNQSVFTGANDIFSCLPPYVNVLLNKCILSPILMNSILSGNVFLSTCVESIKFDSIHQISNEIRDRFYRILSHFLNRDSLTISEYMRKGSAIFKRKIDFDDIVTINSNKFMNSLNSISDQFSFVKILVSNWMMFSNKENACLHSILALIAGIFIQFAWKREIVRQGSDFKKDQYNNIGYKFFKDPIITNVNKFQIHLVHSFNEVQSVYFSLVQLLCLHENFDTGYIVAPQFLFSGKLFYNLSQDLKKRKNSWNYVCQLFESFPCSEIREEFHGVINDVRTISAEFDSFITKCDMV